jgi:F-type H+-transporting ATPase subunit epsilon
MFSINIATPQGLLFSGEVKSCIATGLDGKFQLLTKHAPMISIIDIGELNIKNSGGKREYIATSFGFLEIKNNQLNVIVESAEWAKNIDLDRANSAKERAEKRLAEKDNIDIDRANIALMRAINRIKVSSRS